MSAVTLFVRHQSGWSGARDLNPGPHGPELCDFPSRNVENRRFQFQTCHPASRRVKIGSVLSSDYYTDCYTNSLLGQPRMWVGCAGHVSRRADRGARLGYAGAIVSRSSRISPKESTPSDRSTGPAERLRQHCEVGCLKVVCDRLDERRVWKG